YRGTHAFGGTRRSWSRTHRATVTIKCPIPRLSLLHSFVYRYRLVVTENIPSHGACKDSRKDLFSRRGVEISQRVGERDDLLNYICIDCEEQYRRLVLDHHRCQSLRCHRVSDGIRGTPQSLKQQKTPLTQHFHRLTPAANTFSKKSPARMARGISTACTATRCSTSTPTYASARSKASSPRSSSAASASCAPSRTPSRR